MMKTEDILARIPHQKPFLYVDEILEYSNNHIIGTYTFPKSSDFFNGHFPHKAVVPGVLLTECAAQIGLACFGSTFHGTSVTSAGGIPPQIYLVHSAMDFEQRVFPEQRVRVIAKMEYYRFQKLSVKVSIFVDENRVAKGKLQGMVS
ncbi:MAG: FabA/FabZ family ACP-dehydratase [Psychroflexus sp.]|jgi:3-hydroxyacyl-[acyl-carrier-protein] dehydratase|nr:FabA/FabZ family ACP-dehydratase [Psychroflexus sp.]MDR9449052.1 FabA/FabZ family ACP-dehydratase [Psychroflexus sp.]